MTAEQWNEMMTDNDWNEVELRDSRYNQVVHMVSIADASTGRRRHFSSHEGMDLGTARQLDLAISQVCDKPCIHSASQKKIPPPQFFSDIFPKRLGIFTPNFTCLFYFPIYAGLQIFIQLSATLTAILSATTIVCSKCPPSVETHAGLSHLIWHNLVAVRDNSIIICSLA